MKIAIFNGLPIHFECMGFYIYYCRERGIDYTVFMLPKYYHNWASFYKTYLDTNIKILYPHMDENEITKYDKVILVTDNDIFFHSKFDLHPGLICVDHEIRNRRPNVKVHISMRPIQIDTSSIDKKYVYNLIPYLSLQNKELILKNENSLNLGIIGGGKRNDFNLIKNLKVDWNNTTLYYITREISQDEHERLSSIVANYCGVQNCDSILMFNILSVCHYILFTNNEPAFATERASSSVCMCFSNLCRAVMLRDYNKVYKFLSPIYFEDCPLLDKEIDLNLVYQDQCNMIEHNKKTLDMLIK